MKKILLILLIFYSNSFAQNFTSGPLFNLIQGPYDISGDSTLVVNWDFSPTNSPNKNVSGYFEMYLLVDSLNGTGRFATTDTSDLVLKHRLRVGYDITGTARNRTGTFYVTKNDSSTVFTNGTLAVGIQNFDFSFDESDGWEASHDFGVGDTLQIWYILKATGKQ